VERNDAMKLLSILFVAGVVALAWRWHNQPALRRAEPDPSPPSPDPLDGKPVLGRMVERNTERAFLKRLIAHDASKESRQLQESLVQAERDEKCLRRAMLLMGVLFMLSLAGLSYCAILLPDILYKPGHLVMPGLGYLALGSLISEGAFLGYFLWHRAVVSRLHRECRRLVLALARSHLKVPATPSPSMPGDSRSPGGFPRSSTAPMGMAPHESLRPEALRGHS
jgi:preprotein translocase subunit SecG